MAFINQSKGNENATESELVSIANFSQAQLFRPSKNHLLGIYALEQTQGEKEVRQFIEQLLAADHGPSDTTSSIDKSSRAPPGMKQAEPSQAAR